MRYRDLNKDEFRVNVEGGFSDSKLARLYGVSGRTILRWRIRLGLESHWSPGRSGHGTHGQYRRGCRCRPCTDANAARNRVAIEKMRVGGLPPGDVRHGTGTAYTAWGCRCEPCRAAGAARNRAYMLAHRGEPDIPRWTEREESAVRNHPPAEAARITGRTVKAVYQHRWVLGVTKRHARVKE